MDDLAATAQAATAMATQLIRTVSDDPATWRAWRNAALTAIDDDPTFAMIFVESLAALAAGALLALDAVSPGARAACLDLAEQP